MSGILVYALHYEDAFNKNSLGAVSEAAKLAAELGCEAHAVVIGDVSDELARARRRPDPLHRQAGHGIGGSLPARAHARLAVDLLGLRPLHRAARRPRRPRR